VAKRVVRGGLGHVLSGEPDAFAGTPLIPEIVEYPEDGRVFVMTEPPYTDTPFDDEKGRILRVFNRDDGNPVPPDA
jgi:hypothetical protein